MNQIKRKTLICDQGQAVSTHSVVFEIRNQIESNGSEIAESAETILHEYDIESVYINKNAAGFLVLIQISIFMEIVSF